MEELLFYSYLNYQKKLRIPLTKKIFQLPRIPLCFCLLSFLAMTVAIIAMTCSAQIVEIIAVAVEVLAGFALEYTLESYKIRNSKERITEFYRYTLELKRWLKDNSIESRDDIYEIKKRIDSLVAAYRTQQDALTGRIDRWLQILAVPIAILSITYVINQMIPFDVKFSYIISVLLSFGILYGFISIMKNVSRFVRKRKAEQMEYFAKDLQGVLDLDAFSVRRVECK
jgi:hypothetical protein